MVALSAAACGATSGGTVDSAGIGNAAIGPAAGTSATFAHWGPGPDAPRVSAPTGGASVRTFDPAAVYAIAVDGYPQRGPADALVTLVAVSDYACPYAA